jgi:tRNA pseudouridine55 synthase
MSKEPSGVLCLYKEAGMTSHDAVNKVRRLFHTKQVGHTGTLDPMATGVLPILVGRAVKASEYLLCDDKEYIAGLQLGLTTDTEDVWGKTLTRCQTLPSKEEVLAVKERFLGDILQTPPMYSALKVGGQKLCDLARQNKEVERSPRPIHIYSLEIEPLDEENGLYRLKARVSKGTYIRTLCADIGAALGCGAAMASLERSAGGPFTLEDTHRLSDLEQMTDEERCSLLLPLESLFSSLEALELPEFYGKLASSGCPIYLKKLGCSYPEGRRLRLYRGGVFFALGEVGIHPDGMAVKAIKQFVLFDGPSTKSESEGGAPC